MGNEFGGYRGRPRFGSSTFHMLYGGNRGRLPTNLSSRSAGQVNEAKKAFLHFAFETDFYGMSASTKLKRQILGHMTLDARKTVRNYIKSMNATVNFKSQKNRYRGQNRVFEGNVTITKGTKEYILEHKAEEFREVNVISELALCAFLCFAGIPHHDAQGWIVGNVQESEFESIQDVNSYLMKKALVWKKPIHCTEYDEFKGKVTKKLKQELEDRKLAQKVLLGKATTIKKSSKSNVAKRRGFFNSNNNRQKVESDDESGDGDIEILQNKPTSNVEITKNSTESLQLQNKENKNSSSNVKKRKKKRSFPALTDLNDYWKPSSPKRRRLG